MNSTATRRISQPGFTIVELLVVVVVIAILAAITIVAYNGITASTKESALKLDLTTVAKKLNASKIEDGSFPQEKPDFMSSTLNYSVDGSTFCVHGAANGKGFQITNSGGVVEGSCPIPQMQDFTAAQCSTLAVYSGSNPEAIRKLSDSRGQATQIYKVARLADDKCWMLSNLKLGSTTDTIILTPSDSNVGGNFTLPVLATRGLGGGQVDNDTPRSFGPVPGDTGSGATDYGYLYNWPAATAGETVASIRYVDAQYSICPANWRLPSGGKYLLAIPVELITLLCLTLK